MSPRAFWRWLATGLAGCLMLTPLARAEQPGPVAEKLHPEFKVGPWIWASVTADKQTCRFWRAVEIPNRAPIVEAHLRITADNSYRVFLDGREFGRGTEWKGLTEYDLTWVLRAGTHVIAVEAFNDYLNAGVTLGLTIVFADESVLQIASDSHWRTVPAEERGWMTRKTPRAHWRPAHVVAPYLSGVWKSNPARLVRVPAVQPLEQRFWQTGWFQFTLLVVSALVAAWCVYLLSRLALQAARQEVLQRERARIARDIHDDLGARLTKLVLFGELAQSEIAPASPLRARFEQVSTEGRSILGAIDEVVWTVNSRRDTVRDFEMYVCNYAETFLQPTTLRLRLEAAAHLPDAVCELPVRRNLFLAAKEALNNAVKHSGGTELQLGVHLRGNDLVVTVEDNGRGFDPTAAAEGARNGLTNMAQRTAELGGSCRIESREGGGCRVELIAPLRPRRVSLLRRLGLARAEA